MLVPIEEKVSHCLPFKTSEKKPSLKHDGYVEANSFCLDSMGGVILHFVPTEGPDEN
jgi:hypothetical protein